MTAGQQRLPKFEGRQPKSTKTSVSGGVERPAEISEALKLDSEVIVVARARVSGVNHLETDDGVVREHKLKVSSLYTIDADGDEASVLMETLADREAAAREAATGQQRMNTTPGTAVDVIDPDADNQEGK